MGPIVPKSECEQKMKNTDRFRNKPGFRIHDSWVCIGGEPGSDTCKGDGGSPHVCKNERDEWVQVGAVAWGIGCGDEVPSVYSSIATSCAGLTGLCHVLQSQSMTLITHS